MSVQQPPRPEIGELPPDDAPDRPRWQRRPESRPREIIEAAVTVFAELGYERATVADVARRAGVSPGLVTHYFHTKGELFEAVIADRFLGFIADEEAVLAAHEGSYRELLHRLLRRLWEHASAPGTLELVMIVKADCSALPERIQVLFQELMDRWRRLFEAVLAAGVRRGEFRAAGPCVARAVSACVIGVVEQVRCLGRLGAEPPDLDELWRAAVDLIDRGVLVGGGTVPPPDADRR